MFAAMCAATDATSEENIMKSESPCTARPPRSQRATDAPFALQEHSKHRRVLKAHHSHPPLPPSCDSRHIATRTDDRSHFEGQLVHHKGDGAGVRWGSYAEAALTLILAQLFEHGLVN